MSGLKGAAQAVAAAGRGPDTMIMHVTPDEIRDFSRMGIAAGIGPVGVNPETGMPEAGFFGDLFKGIAGALPGLLGTAFGGPLVGALTQGLFTGATEDDWKKGLRAGLMSYVGGKALTGAVNAANPGNRVVEGAMGVSNAGPGAAPVMMPDVTTTVPPLRGMDFLKAIPGSARQLPDAIGDTLGSRSGMVLTSIAKEVDSAIQADANQGGYDYDRAVEEEMDRFHRLHGRNPYGNLYASRIRRYMGGGKVGPGMDYNRFATGGMVPPTSGMSPTYGDQFASGPQSRPSMPITDIMNWNSATGYAPLPGPGSGTRTAQRAMPGGGTQGLGMNNGSMLGAMGGFGQQYGGQQYGYGHPYVRPQAPGPGPGPQSSPWQHPVEAMTPFLDKNTAQPRDQTPAADQPWGQLRSWQQPEGYVPGFHGEFMSASPFRPQNPVGMGQQLGINPFAQGLGGFGGFGRGAFGAFNPYVGQFGYGGGMGGWGMGMGIGGFGGGGMGGYGGPGGAVSPFGFRAFAEGGPVNPMGGMGDTVEAVIDGPGGVEPARLSVGEFVVPADVVSMIGDGDTDAGAEQLEGMMARIRMQKTGTPEQLPPMDPSNLLG